MTHSSPPQGGAPEPGRRFWLILISRPVLGTLLVLLVLLGLGGWRLWIFVNQELAPLVEQNLRQILHRPVELGELKSFSLTHLRFGPSRVPPYTRQEKNLTVRDPDALTVEAIAVGFDPLALVFSRTLNLEVVLVQPDLLLNQAADGRWLTTPITLEPGAGPMRVNLQALEIRRGEATIVPAGLAPRRLESLEGTVLLRQGNQRFEFGLAGQLAAGGQFELAGVWLRPQNRVTMTVETEDLAASAIADLVPELSLQAQAGRLSADLNLEYQPQQPLEIAGKARLESATLVVPDRWILQSARPQPRSFTEVNGTVTFLENSPLFKFDLRGQLAKGQLRAQGQGSLITQQAKFRLTAQNLPAIALDRAFELPIQPRSGQVNADLTLQIGLRQQEPQVQGQAQLQNVTAEIADLPQLFRNFSGPVRFQGQGEKIVTQLGQLRGFYGEIPLQVQGAIDAVRGYDLRAETAPLAIAPALKTLEVESPFPVSGLVQGQNLRVTGSLENPILTGTVTAPGTPILDQVPFAQVTAEFRLELPQLQVTDIRAIPTVGGTITGEANYNLEATRLEANFEAMNLPGNAIARFYEAAPDFGIGPVAAQAQVRGLAADLTTTVQFQALQGEYPTTGEVMLRGEQTQLRNVISQVAGGQLLTAGEIAEGQFRGIAIPSGIALQQFSPDLRGELSGRLQVTAPIANFSPQTLQAQGQVRLSEGIAIVEQPITAEVRWTGENILVQQATAAGFRASGVIGARFQGPDAPQITTLDLDLNATNYPLERLSPLGPTAVQLRGMGDLRGRLSGTLEALNLDAALQVRQLAVERLAFAPVLSGRLQYGPEAGLDLRLTGGGDRILANLGPDLQPQSFLIQRGEAIAQGTRQGDLLQIDVQDFPLRALNIPVGQLGPITGLASGDFAYNLATNNLVGQIAIARPAIGTLVGDRFEAEVEFAEGILRLQRGELRRGTTQLLVETRLEPGAEPRFEGAIDIARVDLQDLVAALDAFEFARGLQPTPLGTAADLQTEPVGLPAAPLLTQLRRFSEIETLLQQQIAAGQPPRPLPNLADLIGELQGRISFSGSPQTGLQASFNLLGEEIEWGEYTIDQFLASGSFMDNSVRLQPLRVTSNGTLAEFQGQIGGQNQAGQLVLNNVPVDILGQFVELPLELGGQLDATATLSGSLANPQLQGQLAVQQATLNQTPVETAEASFTYGDARLKFESTAVIQGPEPIQISGSLPLPLPFTAAKPASDQISLSAKVQDQGLALLNVLTDQLSWVEGQGRVNVEVGGTLEQPIIEGVATVQNATLQTQVLSEPLRDLTGRLLFNRDRLLVEELRANYNQRPIQAAGALPLTEPLPLGVAQPLRINFDAVNVVLENLYKGEANGNLVVTGSLLNPQLGGSLELARGEVILPNGEPEEVAEEPAAAPPASPPPLEFNGLRVSLNDVRVTRRPLFNFVTFGDLTLGGTLENPAPSGLVRFRQGNVNLFTTRFRLQRDADNFALFDPAQGLDPQLNLSLVTTVTEVTGTRSPLLNPTLFPGQPGPLNEFGDVPAGTIGTIESIRVQARVEGRATQLTTNLANIVELSSSPPRSDGEILALLGGAFAGPLAQGDVELAAAGFATSAFLNTIQGFVDNVLDNQIQFRVFPTLIPDEQNQSVLALGAEVGYDITPRLSVSVLQVLTGPTDPTRFNVGYQFNDNLRLRTGIGTNGEAVGIVEFRTRF